MDCESRSGSAESRKTANESVRINSGVSLIGSSCFVGQLKGGCIGSNSTILWKSEHVGLALGVPTDIPFDEVGSSRCWFEAAGMLIGPTPLLAGRTGNRSATQDFYLCPVH
jgi:hypothetical protein